MDDWIRMPLLPQSVWIKKVDVNENWFIKKSTTPSFLTAGIENVHVTEPPFTFLQPSFCGIPDHADIFFENPGVYFIPAHSVIISQHSLEFCEASKIPFEEITLRLVLNFIYNNFLEQDISLENLIELRRIAIQFNLLRLGFSCNNEIQTRVQEMSLMEISDFISTKIKKFPQDISQFFIFKFCEMAKLPKNKNLAEYLFPKFSDEIKQELFFIGNNQTQIQLLKTPVQKLSKISNFFYTGELSDFTIQVGQIPFRVHRIVLCSTNSFFKTMLEGE